MSQPPHICVVGSTNIDLTFRTARLPRPGETLAGRAFHLGFGGKGANQAVAAARLGAQVSMLGCVGADGNGAQLRAGLEAEGIDCAALETGREATGVALIIVDDASQNAIVIVAGGKDGYVGRDGHPGEGSSSEGPPGA